MIEVPVTQEHIDKSLSNRNEFGPRTQSCAIARALRDFFHTKSARWDLVHGEANGVRYAAVDPGLVGIFIDRHDGPQSSEATPFTLQLEVYSE